MPSKKGIFNFGRDDNHVQKWSKFDHPDGSYDLSHLNAHKVIYELDRSYLVYVTYSHHCFCKAEAGLNDHELWVYNYPKDPRPFHIHRYKYSKDLRGIIENLDKAFIGHAGYEEFATIPVVDNDGQEIFYKIAFTTFRSNKKLRLHVKSAYSVVQRDKLKPIGLGVILRQTLHK